jgi:hypothetical protein
MIVEHVQRWSERRGTYRPAREVVSTRTLEVALIAPRVAKAFVEAHHYSGRCGPTAHPFGLHDRGELVGVAAFGPPPSMNAHRAVWPTCTTDEAVTLSRFVLVDQVGANAESWFFARCLELLRPRGVIAIESCADPRWGHVGTIYQATNGRYVGTTRPATIHVFEDGRVLDNRTEGKVRRGEVGRAYAVGQLVERGATPPRAGEDMRAWLARWTAALTRSVRHRGKHRYLWCLDRRRARAILRAPARPYPKVLTPC